MEGITGKGEEAAGSYVDPEDLKERSLDQGDTTRGHDNKPTSEISEVSPALWPSSPPLPHTLFPHPRIWLPDLVPFSDRATQSVGSAWTAYACQKPLTLAETLPR